MRMHSDELGGPGSRVPRKPTAVVRNRVLDGSEELTPEEELVYHLTSAQQHSQEALNVLYDPKAGVKRSLYYRMVLGRAQSILMSLLMRELRS